MSWNVDQVYSFVRWLINKNQAGGVSSTDLFYAWNSEQTQFQQDLLGRFQARNNGKEGVNTGLIENETILQKLQAFTKPSTITIVSGNAPKPSDFVYRLAFRINGVDCYKINQNQIANVNDSVIDAPSITTNTFYFVQYEDYFYILPHTLPASGITTANLDYIALPKDIVWAYTFDSDDRQVYSPSSITGVDVIYGGVGYTTPTITFSAPAGGGVQATGTLTVVSGVITAVVMTNIGQGYAGLTPTATITGSSTTPANLGNPIVSVQPQWQQAEIIEITKRTLKSLGVHFTQQDFEQFGNSVINTGN